MYDEEDLLPISALQHLLFCPRQCGLMYLEQVWADNRLTASGRVLHERVHAAGGEARGPLRLVRSLRLASLELGLSGVADLVELREATPEDSAETVGAVPGLPGRWSLLPVEYKRGRPKRNPCDRVQLCAQALCLEEMLRVRIESGALFYGRQHRRTPVTFDEALRAQTRDAAERVHQLIRSGQVPPPEYSAKCRSCSLMEACMPRPAARRKASAYVRRALSQMLGESAGEDNDEAT